MKKNNGNGSGWFWFIIIFLIIIFPYLSDNKQKIEKQIHLGLFHLLLRV